MRRIEAIPIDKTSPGLRISADILDADGNILLVEGQVLTSDMISMLQQRQIASVITETTQEMSQEEILAYEESLRARLQHLFRGIDFSPRREQLKELIFQFRKGRTVS